MAVVRRTITRPAAEVFEALVTPPTYPNWLVGCRAMRAVDDGWPAVGTAFHHTVGLVGPLTVDDRSKVLAVEQDRLLSLEVRARPIGRGRATFRLHPVDVGGREYTEVELDEVPIGALGPTEPLANPLIARRNRTSLAALADYVEAGHDVG